MARRMFVGAFTQYSVSHHYSGTWRLPEASGNRGYADVETWVDLVRMAEDAKLDVLMLADALGQGGHFDGDLDTPVREGIFNRMDPSVLVAALSRETSRIGFVVTSSMLQDHPFHFARRMSTLDHLTRGRIGWNVVTSYNPGQWRNFGIEEPLGHEERYAWADEYMEVVYKLWEGSWERDAPVHSVERNTWADPAKVHPIDHVSPRYRVKGPHMVEPSPQGTPLIFQAGSSEQGVRFAARHAEFQFINQSDPDKAGAVVRRVREVAESLGRDPRTLRFAPGMTFIVGRTEAEAKAKFERAVEHFSVTGLAGKLNNMIGFDVSRFGDRVPLADLRTNGIQSTIDKLRSTWPPGYDPTVEELLITNSANNLTVGTPEQLVDRMEALQEVGVDGILLNLMTRPGNLQDFVELIAPEMRARGLLQSEYGPGTLRQQLFGAGDLLPADHPAAGYRVGAGSLAPSPG